MTERYRQLEALEERVVAAERELRAVRGALASLMRCSCPVGFGQQRDANCVKHGGEVLVIGGGLGYE